jgi:molybdopterin synthase catalytic subunit
MAAGVVQQSPPYWNSKLGRALAASRQVCPELCAAVEREIAKNGEISLGSVDYETIFQGIVRRNPDCLGHINIEEGDCNTNRLYYDQTYTLITATAIESIRTKCLYENGEFKNIQIVHRTGPWRPESPYISVSADKDGEKATDTFPM